MTFANGPRVLFLDAESEKTELILGFLTENSNLPVEIVQEPETAEVLLEAFDYDAIVLSSHNKTLKAAEIRGFLGKIKGNELIILIDCDDGISETEASPMLNKKAFEISAGDFNAKTKASLKKELSSVSKKKDIRHSEAFLKADFLLKTARRFADSGLEAFEGNLTKTLREICLLTGSDRCFLHISDPSTGEVERAYEWHRQGLEDIAKSLIGYSLIESKWITERLSGNERVKFTDYSELPASAMKEKDAWIKAGIKSLFGMPFLNRGQLRCFFGVTAERSKKIWSSRDMAVVEEISSLLKLVLSDFISKTDLLHNEKALSIQRDFSSSTIAAQGVKALCEDLLDILLKIESVDSGGIHLADKEGSIRLMAHKGFSEEFLREVSSYDVSSSMDLARILREGKPVYADDEEAAAAVNDLRRKEGLKAVALVPVVVGEKLIAAVNLASHTKTRIPDRDKQLIETFAIQMGVAILQTKAEEALRESETKYKELFDGSRDGIVVVDRNGSFIDANQAYCEMLGYSIKELREMKDFYQITPNYWKEWEYEEIWKKRLLKTGHSGTYEKEYIRKDGTVFPVELHSFTVFGEYGEPMYLWGIARDVTERKQAEEKLKREYEELLTLFDNVEDAIYVADMETHEILFANKSLERAFKKDLVGGICYKELQEKNEPCDFCTNEIIRDLKGKIHKWDFRNPITEHEYELVDKLIRWPDGRFVRFEIAHDITERKNIERERINREEKLKDFIDIASHELKHPVSVIMGFTELLSDFFERMNEKERKEALKALNTGSERLNRITEELLNTSRIERGKFLIERKDQDVISVIRETVREMESRYPEITFSIETKDDSLVWNLDGAKIQELLTILLDNAVRHGKDSDIVEIVVDIKRDTLDISVLDRGPGVPDAQKEDIFERFHQVENAKFHSVPGMGLGLYIAREIAKEHGGNIVCESRHGGGSVFRFSIPSS